MAILIGLDLGEKRVGVAIADERTSLATPLATIEVRGRRQLADELKKIIAEHHVEKIVVGLPYTLKGEMGPQAEKIMGEVEALKQQIDSEWLMWDERLSTLEVERMLVSADVSRQKRKEVRDKLAAQRILQNYLDFLRSHS